MSCFENSKPATIGARFPSERRRIIQQNPHDENNHPNRPLPDRCWQSREPALPPGNPPGRPTARGERFSTHHPHSLRHSHVQVVPRQCVGATAVNAITQSGTVLGVESVGKDNVLCFSPNDWVEITDDWLELNGLPGELHRIAPNGVDASAKTLTLTAPIVTPANFPVANELTDPSRHTRVRRWDQAGKIFESDGVTVWTDLDAAGSTGDIPVPPPGTTLVLENGVTVTFGWDSKKAALKSGDFWNFAARATDGTVEYLDHAPPRGIYHHYCRLGVGNLTTGFADCRVPWPPAASGEGCCECAVCVNADDHNNGIFTIQGAIVKVIGLAGGKVCLGPGTYNVTETIKIVGAKVPLTIVGHGAALLNWAPSQPTKVSTAAILIDSSAGVTLENFGLVVPAATGDAPSFVLNPGVMIQNSAGVTVQECVFLCIANFAAANPALALGGFVMQTSIKNNVISFSNADGQIVPGVGLSHLPTIATESASDFKPNTTLLTLDIYVQDNFIQTGSSGIDLDGLSIHAWQVRLNNNFIGPSSVAGIMVAGAGVPASTTAESSVEITDNEIVTLPTGHGIVCGVGAARISENDILCLTPIAGLPNESTVGDGILLDAPHVVAETTPALDGLQLVGNRISGVAGIGIEFRAQIGSAIIHQNLIEKTGAGGIIMTASFGVPDSDRRSVLSTAQHLSIANNQLLDLIPDLANPFLTRFNAAIGIGLVSTDAAEIEGNIVRNLALEASNERKVSLVGIGLLACVSVRISGNKVVNIGNANVTFNLSAGIAVGGPSVGRVDVSGNTSQRSESETSTPNAWFALFIGTMADPLKLLNLEVVPLKTNRSVILGDSSAVLAEAGLPAVSVRGNYLEASTISPLAQVALDTSGTGSCIFTENQCVLIDSGNSKRQVRNVILSAPAVIASNNAITGGSIGLDINAPLGNAKLAPATIVGNILNTGKIQLNSNPLQHATSPWGPLNVFP
jgi:uncharacterized protein DUF6519